MQPGHFKKIEVMINTILKLLKRYLPFFSVIFLLLFIYNESTSLTIAEIIIAENKKSAEGAEKTTFDQNLDFLPPLEDKDFFASINDLSICREKQVRGYIYQYLTEGRVFLVNAINKMPKYLPVVNEIISEDQTFPSDISLLPLLESGYNPYAVSRSRAVGLWQLLKGTSGALGLKTNDWVDERRDIEKSTAAAVKHLNNLYGIFQAWDLALAAYNGGAGYIAKTMRKTGAKTLKELIESKKLVRETNEFVYRFAALAIIYKNQSLFNITEIPAVETIETENIIFEYPVDLHYACRLTEIPLETIRTYNPELNQKITPPYEKNYSIRVPVELKEKIESSLEQLYAVRYTNLKKHVVKKGECISIISAIYKINSEKIIELNNIKNPRSIRPGLELYIPI